tara:strand:- start:262 stop:1380 length:1119 start_codon:yes stop_codon:yes gene_type:complete
MYLIVGCGLTGATIAERISSILNKKVIILDKRSHIGGNCYDYRDKETDILMCKYGAHIFRTNNKEIWNYINKFSDWERWEHKVLSYVDNKFVNVPVNMTTINVLCNETLQTKEDIDDWLKKNQVKYNNITNSEEICQSRIGKTLYNKMFKNYTYKQWNKFPIELDKSVLENIPIRKSFDTRYFDHKYQGLPKNGYTNFINNMISHKNIKILLNTSYEDYIKNNSTLKFDGIIFTGPIDEYFKNSGLHKLEYRSLDFEIIKYKNMNYYQPASVVNYPENNVPYTRIVEYKHFLNQKSNDTVIVKETSNSQGEPFYPVPNKRNMDLYDSYKQLAIKEEEKNKVYFVGRLANYKYFNMDQAIQNAIDFFSKKLLS